MVLEFDDIKRYEIRRPVHVAPPPPLGPIGCFQIPVRKRTRAGLPALEALRNLRIRWSDFDGRGMMREKQGMRASSATGVVVPAFSYDGNVAIDLPNRIGIEIRDSRFELYRKRITRVVSAHSARTVPRATTHRLIV